MESISDVWKSARERFTNPFAFAYIVAWLLYNWEITIAIFFTDVSYEQLFWIINNRRVGFLGWFLPIAYAAGYVVIIAFIRQVVDWLNVKFNKMGTKWVIEESKGGKVSIEKYMEERDKLMLMTKELEHVYDTEKENNERYNRTLTDYHRTSEQYAASQKANTQLQTDLSAARANITGLEQAIAGTHNYTILRGRWDVKRGIGHDTVEFIVSVSDLNVYTSTYEGINSRIVNLFYNQYTHELFFYIIDPARNGKIHVFDLMVSTEHHLEGTENGIQIHFNRRTIV